MDSNKKRLTLLVSVTFASLLALIALSVFAVPACAADIPVTGTVTDVNGQPVPGIEVRIFIKYADQADYEGVTGSVTGHDQGDAGKYAVSVPGVDLARSPTIKAQARYIDQTAPDGQSYFAETTITPTSDVALTMDIHYTAAFPTRENQFILDGTIYVDEVPTNGITVTATLNGNTKSDVTGSSGEAGYYRIVFPPTPGTLTLSYTFNGETQTMDIPYTDTSIGGSRSDFHLSTASSEVPNAGYAIAGHVYLDGNPVNGASVSTDYGGGASNVTFTAPEFGDGMYLLLLQNGNGSAVVSVSYNNITGTISIASPNLTGNGYDMADVYLVTPGASPAAGGTSTPGPTMAPGDISGLIGSTPTPVPTNNAGTSVTPTPTSSPSPTPAPTKTPSVLLSGPGAIAILSLIGYMAGKKN